MLVIAGTNELGGRMTDISWLLDVLVDLRDYARNNQLQRLEQKLLDTAMIALCEIGGGTDAVQRYLDLEKNEFRAVEANHRPDFGIIPITRPPSK